MFELMVEDTFDAAHALRGYEGPCENLHGHTWKVQMFLKGNKLDKLGMLQDFKIIKKRFGEVIGRLDHQNLNETAPFDVKNPTSEIIAEVLFGELKKKFKNLTRVTVWESGNTYASYS